MREVCAAQSIEEGERVWPGHQLDRVVLRRPGDLEAALLGQLHELSASAG